MTALNRLGVALATVVTFAALGCQRDRPAETAPVVRTPLEEALFLGEIHALANGGAYVSSLRGPIFYVANGVAENVSGLPADTSGTSTITPLADGTALFLTSFSNPPRLYWLRGPKASAVEEGRVGPQARFTLSPQGFQFAENQRLRRQLEETAGELGALEGADEADYEQDPY